MVCESPDHTSGNGKRVFLHLNYFLLEIQDEGSCSQHFSAVPQPDAAIHLEPGAAEWLTSENWSRYDFRVKAKE